MRHPRVGQWLAPGVMAVLGCSRGSNFSSMDSSHAPPPDAGAPCAHVQRFGVGVEGTYAFDSGEARTAPRLMIVNRPGPVYFSFPELPAVTVPPGEMCTAHWERGDLVVDCVAGPNSVRSFVPSRLELANGFGVDPACVEIEDRVGEHDVRAVAQAWAEAAKGCDTDGRAHRHVRFVLEVPPVSPADRHGVRHVLPRLRAPALGVSIALGEIAHDGSCYAQRFESPRGVAYACSEMDIEMAAVYQVGRAIFYRTKNPQLSTIPLPCGVDADFEVNSSEHLDWE